VRAVYHAGALTRAIYCGAQNTATTSAAKGTPTSAKVATGNKRPNAKSSAKSSAKSVASSAGGRRGASRSAKNAPSRTQQELFQEKNSEDEGSGDDLDLDKDGDDDDDDEEDSEEEGTEAGPLFGAFVARLARRSDDPNQVNLQPRCALLQTLLCGRTALWGAPCPSGASVAR
jgi:hypothetical protein